MTLHRRRFLHLAVSAVALPTLSRVALGQFYPSQPVRVIVGFAGGGPNDILARLIGQWLAKRLGHPFVIEEPPGAGRHHPTQAVVAGPPHRYTFLLGGSPT